MSWRRRGATGRRLTLTLRNRADRTRAYFDQLAGKFGRSYCPGAVGRACAEAMLLLMPRQVVADLGAGEGTFSQLLAKRAERVIAVDSSEKMVAFGAKVAAENGCHNLEYRLGDLEAPPLVDGGSASGVFQSGAASGAAAGAGS